MANLVKSTLRSFLASRGASSSFAALVFLGFFPVFSMQATGQTTLRLAVSPTSATLRASQTQQFKATVTGTSNATVTWSLNPFVGTITSVGLYTAPASISSSQSVNVIATSAADSRKTATAVVSLKPTVTVAVSPNSATFRASQTQQFKATVTGTSNSAVTWSLNPVVGTINSAGLYTAPASLSSSQTVNIIATSSADSTKTATAIVSLQPSVSVVVSPTGAALRASQTQQFKATVAGTSNTAVTWSLNPAVGTVNSTGLYTAPGSISSSQNVNVIATSAADTTKTATATVNLQGPAPPANLVATPASTSTVNLTWSAAASGGLPVQNYRVYRGTTSSNLSQLAIISQTSYTDSTVTAAVTYYYAVAATDTAEDLSPISAVVKATVPTAPSAPTGLLATPVSNTTISVTWSAAASGGLPIQNYYVFRATTSSTWSHLATVAQPAYTDASGSSATEYYYAVQAADSGGDLSAMSATVSATTLALLSAPTNLVASAPSNVEVNLNWTAPPSGMPLASYSICRGTSISSLTSLKVVPATLASTTDTTVSPGTTYYYGIQAKDTGGNISPMSPVVVVTTPTNVVSLKDFGAKGDGITDDTAAIQAAHAAICAAGGGDLLYPAGTYLIQPVSGVNTSTFQICSNMHITLADGATILVKSDAGDYDTLYGPRPITAEADNVTFDGPGIINQNVYNNTTSNIRPANPTATAQMAITLFSGLNFKCRGVTFYNSGINTLDINGPSVSGVLISRNSFTFQKRTGNATFDNSTIYLSGTDYDIETNTFRSTLTDSAATAIEVHVGTGTVVGNTIDLYSVGMNIVDTVGALISANTLTGVAFGVDLWSTTATGPQTGTQVYGNTVSINNVDRLAPSTCGICLAYDSHGVTGAFTSAVISGNTITHQIEPSGRVVWGYSNYGIGLLSYGAVSDVLVTTNTIINAPVRGIKIGNCDAEDAETQTTRVTVQNNLIVDAGLNTDSSAYGYDAAIEADGNNTNVYVDHNRIQFTTNPFRGHYSIYTTTWGGHAFTNLQVYDNQITEMNGLPVLSLDPTTTVSVPGSN